MKGFGYFLFLMMFWSGMMGVFVLLFAHHVLTPFPAITGILFSLCAMAATGMDKKVFVKAKE